MKTILAMMLSVLCYIQCFSMEIIADHEIQLKTLPPEMLVLIACFLTNEKNSIQAVCAINYFARVNKYVYAVLYDPVVLNQLSKQIAQKFGEPATRIEALFLTPKAKEWLAATFKKYKKAAATDKEVIMLDSVNTDATEILSYLFDHGVNINGYAKKYPPLVMGVLHNKPKIVDFLLKRGADVDQVDSEERTAIFYISSIPESQKEQIFMLVIAQKPNLSISDADDHTPLMHAVSKDDLMLVKLLVKYGANINQPIVLANKTITDALSYSLWKMLNGSAPHSCEIYEYLRKCLYGC